MEYPKIETVFERNEKFNVTDVLKNRAIGLIKSWQVTEKIDGTNIRVMLSKEGKMTVGGKTDNAQIQADLVKYLFETFNAGLLQEVFWRPNKGTNIIEPVSVVLYGEGYGAGIQKGGVYSKTKSFRLFDVLIGEKWWLNWKNTCEVANKLGIKTVPFMGDFTLEEIVRMVSNGFPSVVSQEDGGQDGFNAEGIVGRTVETLFDKKGHRLIIKLKQIDFNHR